MFSFLPLTKSPFCCFDHYFKPTALPWITMAGSSRCSTKLRQESFKTAWRSHENAAPYGPGTRWCAGHGHLPFIETSLLKNFLILHRGQYTPLPYMPCKRKGSSFLGRDSTSSMFLYFRGFRESGLLDRNRAGVYVLLKGIQ